MNDPPRKSQRCPPQSSHTHLGWIFFYKKICIKHHPPPLTPAWLKSLRVCDESLVDDEGIEHLSTAEFRDNVGLLYVATLVGADGGPRAAAAAAAAASAVAEGGAAVEGASTTTSSSAARRTSSSRPEVSLRRLEMVPTRVEYLAVNRAAHAGEAAAAAADGAAEEGDAPVGDLGDAGDVGDVGDVGNVDDATWLAEVLTRDGRRLGFGTSAAVDDVRNLRLQWGPPGAGATERGSTAA
jgi:hypothetical protein